MAVDLQSRVLIPLLQFTLRSWDAVCAALRAITGARVVSRTVTWIAAGAPPYVLTSTMYGLCDKENKLQLVASISNVPGRFDLCQP